MNKNLQIFFENFYKKDRMPVSPAEYFSRPEKFIKLLHKYNIKSLFDCGCRDRDWIRNLNFDQENIKYSGGDISKFMVDFCNQEFPNLDIRHFDCTTDNFPEVDCILLSDVLIHLSYNHKLKCLQNFIQSNSKFVLLTFDYVTKNDEIIETTDVNFFQTASINWHLPPWNFPTEIDSISDTSNDKRLKLWSSNQLKDIILNL